MEWEQFIRMAQAVQNFCNKIFCILGIDSYFKEKHMKQTSVLGDIVSSITPGSFHQHGRFVFQKWYWEFQSLLISCRLVLQTESQSETKSNHSEENRTTQDQKKLIFYLQNNFVKSLSQGRERMDNKTDTGARKLGPQLTSANQSPKCDL